MQHLSDPVAVTMCCSLPNGAVTICSNLDKTPKMHSKDPNKMIVVVCSSCRA